MTFFDTATAALYSWLAEGLTEGLSFILNVCLISTMERGDEIKKSGNFL